MTIEWLPAAERVLRSQLEWIAEQHPWAAIDVGDAITAAVDRVADHPATARQVEYTAHDNSSSWAPDIVIVASKTLRW